ncbi:NAD(P)/FAD-dependent oxidoreductase [Nocardioides sp. TRM66260-LWL]|uniref:flavin-containing monooxygenase n=1 Tax=Nocardioides sp. TRM66260-LWL TaxID=2874478 RepID=UPI001CC51CB8|nr:NAD(P)/FAD-dependent oxidoreductase [Nocardioides sp. TRM66260-LWL]MBZ5736014.1 NAD(P)/FAD-dependent oxidoreductase [Nocardioides sp. TRM66260-LWL]
MPTSEPQHVDVLIVGAGLSGIGAACQLKTAHPERTLAVLEAREASGGTWDLFRYPGIRSDSDMFTFGYRWRPWPSHTSLADGALILDYLRTVAEEHGVDRLIRYRHKVTAAEWDTASARWTVTVEVDGESRELTCSFLWGTTGYYDYDEGHRPQFPQEESFEGTIVHPQFWPEDLDYAGKKVVVIGSGATAITLLPSMADKTEHITMLQRTPTYILPQPGEDELSKRLDFLPFSVKYPIVRWANVMRLVASYQLARRYPDQAKRFVRRFTERQLPEGTSYDENFQPPYQPWDQRLCVVPNSDLFRALRKGDASVVTGRIKRFDATGIELESGEHLEADIIVTATGLKLKLFGGITLTIDGEKLDPSSSMAYKALMLSGVPNFAYTIGYTNASWTLKADLVGDYVNRLLSYMDAKGKKVVVPVRDETVGERPFMDLASGYVQRALDGLPRQGDRAPWSLKQNYLSDIRTIRRDRIDDGVLSFS